ncbi:unnamed protein product [Paramecium pentaurelia]|uniref:Uncharacterized protein n=1 Tax=Paramecium pentaurelia TaxID=43138 RepID=A0A8S1RRD6_9CILI|nr:unnamed protein product [Paramecium pentaurelia]
MIQRLMSYGKMSNACQQVLSKSLNKTSKSYFSQAPQQGSSNTELVKIFAAFFGIVGLGTGGYVAYQNSQQQKKQEAKAKQTHISNQTIDNLRQKSIENEEQKKEEIITMFSDVNDRMLRYRGDPTSEKMLADYTIYGDLKWFEVDPEEWEKPEEEMIMKDENEIVKHPIRRALINERLTHAFEAERILQSIFVNVNDVLSEIERTGTYTPPGIFFRFYGYVYFQIRRKPINIENLVKAQKYISLFDLFFQYQTPVLYYHNQYLEIPLKPAIFDNIDWLPNAYINSKQQAKIYLTGKPKHVFSMRIKQGTVDESTQRFAWTNHYK